MATAKLTAVVQTKGAKKSSDDLKRFSKSANDADGNTNKLSKGNKKCRINQRLQVGQFAQTSDRQETPQSSTPKMARKESPLCPTSFLGMESQVDPKYLESTASRPNEQKRDIKSIEPLSGRGRCNPNPKKPLDIQIY